MFKLSALIGGIVGGVVLGVSLSIIFLKNFSSEGSLALGVVFSAFGIVIIAESIQSYKKLQKFIREKFGFPLM